MIAGKQTLSEVTLIATGPLDLILTHHNSFGPLRKVKLHLAALDAFTYALYPRPHLSHPQIHYDQIYFFL